MNVDNITILVPEHIGAPFEGGFYGGKINSHGGAKTLAIVWAPKAEGELSGMWLYRYNDVPGARSCFHSMDNTRAMAAAGSDLAKNALNLRIGGYEDWCIPARDVLELGFRHLKPGAGEAGGYFRDGDNPSSVPVGYPYSLGELPTQTTVAAFQSGGEEAFEEAYYWSSTQYSSDDAWSQVFSYGGQYDDGKKAEARCRAVRLIQLNP